MADDRRIPFDTVVKNRCDANSLQIFVKHPLHARTRQAAHKRGDRSFQRGDQRRGAITALAKLRRGFKLLLARKRQRLGWFLLVSRTRLAFPRCDFFLSFQRGDYFVKVVSKVNKFPSVEDKQCVNVELMIFKIERRLINRD